MTALDEHWVDGQFRLPVDANLPVVVRLTDGGTERTEYRDKVEGDWRQVTAWRRAKPGDKPRKRP